MTPSAVPKAYPQRGEIIDGKYEVIELLGEGGMGAVAKARHLIRGVPVALKFIAPHVLAMSGALERFLNEAAVASQIRTDHVATALDVGRLPSGAPYLVLEYLEGRDLAAVVEENPGGVDVARAVHFVLQILRALQVAHDAGVIHRDLKPANCFVVEKEGDPDFVKVLDFGISKLKAPGTPSITQTGSALGTPLYMSPEQARSPKNVDARSDLWSAGTILYELLSGRTPYVSESGEVTEVIIKLFTQEPTPLGELRPALDPALCALVHKALSHEREGRFGDAREMADALAPFADARSRQVLERIRSHRPGEMVKGVSGLDVFTQLAGGSMPPRQSDLPPAMSSPPPSDAVSAHLDTISADHVSIRPPTDDMGRVSPVARTALSVARDEPAPAATQAGSPGARRLPVIVAVALVVAAGLGAVVVFVRPSAEPAKPEAPPSAVLPQPTAIVLVPTAPSAAPSAAPSSPSSAAPDAGPAPRASHPLSTGSSTGATTTPRPGLSTIKPME